MDTLNKQTRDSLLELENELVDLADTIIERIMDIKYNPETYSDDELNRLKKLAESLTAKIIGWEWPNA